MFFKNHAENEITGLVSDLFLPLKKLTKDKIKWLKMQVSRPETRLERESSTGIFLWFSLIFTKDLIYRTLLDDCFCWFLFYKQGFITPLWLHFFRFFLHVFTFIIDMVDEGIKIFVWPLLIWLTNLLWFKKISKGRLYQFNCHFLSKIDF